MAGALLHRDFRLVWFAALGSTIGTWMQKYAQSLLVYDLSKSGTGGAVADPRWAPFYLGLDDFVSQLPILLFMLIGGVIADRYDRRRLLTGSQYVQAFSAFSLAALVFWGEIQIWHVLALSFLSGLGQAFGGPAYQSLLPSLVPRRDLPNAIALNSTQFNLSRLLGPLGGTAVLASLGIAACFFLNGVSFFLVILALIFVRPAPLAARAEPPKALMRELRSGLSYVRHERLMLTLTVLVFITTFLTMPIATFLPIFAAEVFADEPGLAATRLSIFLTCQALGAIVGALFVGSLGRFKHMGFVMLGTQMLLGVVMAAFAVSRVPALSYALLFLGGIGSMAVFSMSFSIVQLAVPEDLRGRVVSIYMVALRGGWPIGGLVAGYLAVSYTAPTVLLVNGLILAIGTAALLLSGRVRSLRAL